MLSYDKEFPAKLVKKMKNITWYEYGNGLDGAERTDVCVRAYSFQDVFTPAGWPSPGAFHVTERERRNETKTEKRKRGRERERQKYREREDTLITGGLVSLSYACDSTEVFCLVDSVFGWDVFGARIHTNQVLFKNSNNHINTLEGLWLFFLPFDYLPTE